MKRGLHVPPLLPDRPKGGLRVTHTVGPYYAVYVHVHKSLRCGEGSRSRKHSCNSARVQRQGAQAGRSDSFDSKCKDDAIRQIWNLSTPIRQNSARRMRLSKVIRSTALISVSHNHRTCCKRDYVARDAVVKELFKIAC